MTIKALSVALASSEPQALRVLETGHSLAIFCDETAADQGFGPDFCHLYCRTREIAELIIKTFPGGCCLESRSTFSVFYVPNIIATGVIQAMRAVVKVDLITVWEVAAFASPVCFPPGEPLIDGHPVEGMF